MAGRAETVDALILGSGTGGTALALHLAGTGQSVAVVERRWMGGACPNIACLPSKNEIWSAKVADLARRYLGEMGLGTLTIGVDMEQVRQRKRAMVDGLSADIRENFRARGVELILGQGRFVGSKALRVELNAGGTRDIEAGRVFLNVGTRAAIPAIPGLAAANPLTHIEALELDCVPAHLAVIGGGYVGLELGQAFRRFGSEVTVVESGPQLIPREDPDVAAELANVLSEEGLEILTMADVLRVEGRSGQRVRCHVRSPSGERIIDASDVLVAAGRTPNTADIGLDAANVEVDKRGYIQVDDRLRTSAANIWALGECAGSPQFTHVSYDDFRIVRDNLSGGVRSTRGRVIPFCVFTDPPFARVGLNETEACQQRRRVRVARLPIKAIGRARTTGEISGFMKAIADADNNRILGFSMIGAEAGELVAIVQTAMLAELPYPALADAPFAHPTMAEGLESLFASMPTNRGNPRVSL